MEAQGQEGGAHMVPHIWEGGGGPCFIWEEEEGLGEAVGSPSQRGPALRRALPGRKGGKQSWERLWKAIYVPSSLPVWEEMLKKQTYQAL